MRGHPADSADYDQTQKKNTLKTGDREIKKGGHSQEEPPFLITRKQ
jgi:hypothetical protein